MPVSGLAITLSSDARAAAECLRALETESRIELGPRHGNRLAIVTETQSQEEDKALWAWLDALPGVTLVDVAFVHFDPPPRSEPRTVSAPEPSTASRAACQERRL